MRPHGSGTNSIFRLVETALDPKFTRTYTDEYGTKHTFSTRKPPGGEVAQVHLGGINAVLVTHAASFKTGPHGEILHGLPMNWYDELSHTCGIPFCLDHTLWELPWDNVWRDGCHKYGHYPPGRCPHSVKCLRQPNLARARAALRRGYTDRVVEQRANLEQDDPKLAWRREMKRKRNHKRYADPAAREKDRERNKLNQRKRRAAKNDVSE